MTVWVRPKQGGLPQMGADLERFLAGFYGLFPEYADCLTFFQSPRFPRHLFVYVREGCSGVLPGAGQYLQKLLETAFPDAEIRLYGKAWLEV